MITRLFRSLFPQANQSSKHSEVRPVVLDTKELALVAGGAPRGGWLSTESQEQQLAPRGGW